MKIQHQDIAICIFLTCTTVVSFYLSSQFREAGLHSNNDSWVYRLLGNMFGYGIILIPGYIVLKYVKRINYIENANKGCLWPIIRDCVYGQEPDIPHVLESEKADRNQGGSANTVLTTAVSLGYCFLGLQVSYLTWGYLQEKIITQTYDGKVFHDSQFLVFQNRIFGLLIASGYIFFKEPRSRAPRAPLYKYSYCAFSNVMSSWFQYEALKFVSFPTQVLAKATKIIPVMLMGKLVSNKKYEFYEYLTAVLISLGMLLFLSGSDDTLQTGKDHANSSSATATGFSGLIILVCYMAFDSFTSNWQSELFQVYKISAFRMMAGVNLFSLLLTGVSSLQQGSLAESALFLFHNTDFALDCFILSICSAVGQLFIYHTIEKFGPVIFIIIMSIRQAFAVILSCLFFHHPISTLGVIGVLVVFLSIFLRIYCSYRMKQVRGSKSVQAIPTSGSLIKI